MKRWMRWWLWRLLVLAVIVAAAWIAYQFVLPGVIESKIRAALSDAGFAQAQFTLDGRPTLNRMALKDVQVDDEGRLRIARIEALYDPARLLSGRVAMVKLTGVRWRVTVNDDGTVITGLESLSVATDASENSLFERVEIDDAVIEAEQGTRQQELSIKRIVWGGGELQVWMDPATVALDSQTLAGGVLAKLTGLQITGNLTLSADGVLTAKLADVNVGSADHRYEIRGVEGDLTLQPTWPIRSAPGQVLQWKQAVLGPTTFGAGAAQFTVENPRRILVEQVNWLWGTTGQMWLGTMRIDPMNIDIDAQLFIESVDLQDWLSVATVGYAQGDGKLYGRVRLRMMTQPQLRFALNDGYLYTVDGGNVKVNDPSLVDQVLSQQLLDTDQINAAVRQRIVQALHDFDYKLLAFVFTQKDGKPVLSAHVAGEGGTARQGLDITFNFTGFEDVIDLGLRIKLGLDRATDQRLKQMLQRRSP